VSKGSHTVYFREMVQANFKGNAAVEEIQKPDDSISVHGGNQDKLCLDPAPRKLF
jgi:hypothetical protein